MLTSIYICPAQSEQQELHSGFLFYIIWHSCTLQKSPVEEKSALFPLSSLPLLTSLTSLLMARNPSSCIQRIYLGIKACYDLGISRGNTDHQKQYVSVQPYHYYQINKKVIAYESKTQLTAHGKETRGINCVNYWFGGI